MPADYSLFVNYRASLEVPHREGTYVSGIVKASEGNLLQLACQHKEGFTAGDKVRGFIILHHKRVDFSAEVLQVRETGFWIRLSTDVTVSNSDQVGRHEVDYSQIAKVNGITFATRVVDISADGVGLESHCRLGAGTRIEVEFNYQGGVFKVPFEVKYCKEAAGPDQYRVGCQIATTEPGLLNRYQVLVHSTEPILQMFRRQAS